MIIKCTFQILLEDIRDYTRQVMDLPPLPEYITKRGPYIKEKGGAGNQIITIYEFDKSKLSEAWENISKQVDAVRGVSGFTLSAHVLRKGKNFNRG
jgi:hypothetical protein